VTHCSKSGEMEMQIFRMAFYKDGDLT